MKATAAPGQDSHQTLVMLTDLLTTIADDRGCSWTRPPTSTSGSRAIRQQRTGLDDQNLATDQKARICGRSYVRRQRNVAHARD
jgi:hypothetical protein